MNSYVLIFSSDEQEWFKVTGSDVTAHAAHTK